MLANFFIGLREGLEAALIVGILVAYVIKIGQPQRTKTILAGVAAAVVASVAVALALNYAVETVPAGTSEIIAGTSSALAVVFVTWMIFWMKSQSKALGASLRGQVDSSLSKSSFALFAIAFTAVIREGVETSVFLWSASQATNAGDNPVLGAVLGLGVATVAGYLLFKGALKINISKFFNYTGAFLILVSAGILAYAVKEFEEVFTLPLQQITYDVSNILPKKSPIESVLHGMIGFNAKPTYLQTLVWLAYMIPVTYLFARKTKVKA
ncbi:MAG: hypothetical protein RIR29_563 [Actinomycetota bacterium]|jgi:high-affinity iron transporter